MNLIKRGGTMIEFLGWIFLLIIIYSVIQGIRQAIKERIKDKQLCEKLFLYSLSDSVLPMCIKNYDLPTWVINQNHKKIKFFANQLNTKLREDFISPPSTKDGQKAMLIFGYYCARAIEINKGNILYQVSYAESKIRNYIEMQHKNFDDLEVDNETRLLS